MKRQFRHPGGSLRKKRREFKRLCLALGAQPPRIMVQDGVSLSERQRLDISICTLKDAAVMMADENIPRFDSKRGGLVFKDGRFEKLDIPSIWPA